MASRAQPKHGRGEMNYVSGLCLITPLRLCWTLYAERPSRNSFPGHMRAVSNLSMSLGQQGFRLLLARAAGISTDFKNQQTALEAPYASLPR